MYCLLVACALLSAEPDKATRLLIDDCKSAINLAMVGIKPEEREKIACGKADARLVLNPLFLKRDQIGMLRHSDEGYSMLCKVCQVEKNYILVRFTCHVTQYDPHLPYSPDHTVAHSPLIWMKDVEGVIGESIDIQPVFWRVTTKDNRFCLEELSASIYIKARKELFPREANTSLSPSSRKGNTKTSPSYWPKKKKIKVPPALKKVSE